MKLIHNFKSPNFNRRKYNKIEFIIIHYTALKNVNESINFINSLGYKSYYLSGSKLENTEKLNNYKNKNNYFFIR